MAACSYTSHSVLIIILYIVYSIFNYVSVLFIDHPLLINVK